MSALYLKSVGVLGPGLPDWPSARAALAGQSSCDTSIAPQPNVRLLPANERRRVPTQVRWVMAAAQQAVAGAEREARDVVMVFSSSSGDGEIVHRLCEAVAAPPREVSPTLFHNSVHNAPAGYWSIGTGSQQRSVALCGYDASFTVGLIEAAALVLAERARVLLVACDLPFPQPLAALRRIDCAFAVALLLAPEGGTGTLARWRVSLARGAARTALPAMLEPALASNPAAQGLPLLAAAARGGAGCIRLAHLGEQHVAVEVEPCS